MADVANSAFVVQQIEKFCVIEFRKPSLMDPAELDYIGRSLYKLVDEQDKRRIIMDFEKVTYISSQAIGIVLQMNNKLSKLGNSKFVLCGVGPKLMDLVKIMRLDKVLTIKPTQREALNVF